MGPFRGPYRGSPLWDPCWWAVTTEVAAHWEEVLMGPFRGGAHIYEFFFSNNLFPLFFLKKIFFFFFNKDNKPNCLFVHKGNIFFPYIH